MKKPLIVIIGPTATGKSDLACEIALRVSGEIVSADSRQVYCGLDIGTGKITKEEMKGVPHYLLDVADPKNTFTVVDYKKLAEEAISKIYQNGNIPILAGGTGLYVDTIVHDLKFPEVLPNKALREKLEKEPKEKLFNILLELDPVITKTIDKDNKRRLVRAIEIAKAIGKVPKLKHRERFDTSIYYLDYPDQELRKRIDKRIDARIKEGMIEEAIKLHKKSLSFERMRELGLEYRYLADYLEDKLSLDEFKNTLKLKIWQYAKRQRTWFKKYRAVAKNI